MNSKKFKRQDNMLALFEFALKAHAATNNKKRKQYTQKLNKLADEFIPALA